VRQIPGYSLWLGNIADARDLKTVLAADISAMVDLALNEPPAKVTREVAYLRFPLVDGSGNPPWLLRGAVQAVAHLVRSGIRSLVYCSTGHSRSLCVAGAAIAQVKRMPLTEGLALVAGSGPADVSPGLWWDVQQVVKEN
jgi:protein-tyrosine phosphatase